MAADTPQSKDLHWMREPARNTPRICGFTPINSPKLTTVQPVCPVVAEPQNLVPTKRMEVESSIKASSTRGQPKKRKMNDISAKVLQGPKGTKQERAITSHFSVHKGVDRPSNGNIIGRKPSGRQTLQSMALDAPMISTSTHVQRAVGDGESAYGPENLLSKTPQNSCSYVQAVNGVSVPMKPSKATHKSTQRVVQADPRSIIQDTVIFDDFHELDFDEFNSAPPYMADEPAQDYESIQYLDAHFETDPTGRKSNDTSATLNVPSVRMQSDRKVFNSHMVDHIQEPDMKKQRLHSRSDGTEVGSLDHTVTEPVDFEYAGPDGEEFASDMDWPDDTTLIEQEHGIAAKAAESANHPASSCLTEMVVLPPLPPHVVDDNDHDEFEDWVLDSTLVGMTSPATSKENVITPETSPPCQSTPKLEWLPPKTFKPTAVSTNVAVTQVNVPHLLPLNASGNPVPFARPPFPKAVLDRSPIAGLTNTTVLRTCFRIGEALNAAAIATRSHSDAIIELYARVMTSDRPTKGGRCRQTFQFKDLFTDKPPYLSGHYSLWKGVELWDVDSSVFLGKQGRDRKCRVVGRIRRLEREGAGCEMTVLSIWEIQWEEVGIAKGMVCS